MASHEARVTVPGKHHAKWLLPQAKARTLFASAGVLWFRSRSVAACPCTISVPHPFCLSERSAAKSKNLRLALSGERMRYHESPKNKSRGQSPNCAILPSPACQLLYQTDQQTVVSHLQPGTDAAYAMGTALAALRACNSTTPKSSDGDWQCV
jgi:hypothetical protein